MAKKQAGVQGGKQPAFKGWLTPAWEELHAKFKIILPFCQPFLSKAISLTIDHGHHYTARLDLGRRLSYGVVLHQTLEAVLLGSRCHVLPTLIDRLFQRRLEPMSPYSR